MLNAFSHFKNDDSGAVTVDWVVLTAAIVGIAMAVIALISGGVGNASNGINDGLETAGTFSNIFASASPYGLEGGFVPFIQGGYDDFYSDATAPGVDTASYYADAYLGALIAPDEASTDRLAASEQAMLDGNLGIPEGNQSASDLQAGYSELPPV